MFDLVVIGGGSGGVRAARIAAGFGAKVAIIEQRFWGGTCVNVGCVPKKMYHYAGSLPMAFELAQAYGWSMQVGELNWQQFHRQKDNEINRLQGIYRRMLANAGVEVIDGFGRVVDAHTVDVDGQTIGAKRILIATGGQPTLLDIPGVEHCLDSDALFVLDTLPESLLVIGGGYIACEMASTYEHLGVKVRWINRSKPLKSFDAEMVEFLLAEMAKPGLCCDTGITPVSVELTATGKKAVTLSSGEVVEVDQVLMATGRKPNIEKLGLDAVGVELTADGHIAVNEDYQTSVESIYAVGDVIPGYDLTPVALEQGMYLAKTLFDQRPSLRPAFDTVATVIFTHPQFANVGMTEETAKAKG
ncbi:MAG: FAD-dependent oxidoreductase, partial [Pseudomonadota bacterium]|nr:FAD-dependent oxidoreductase [Pseudomonadota bacterium]